MGKEMKVIGVAPLIALPTFAFLTLAIVVSFLADGAFSIVRSGYGALAAIGSALIVVGVAMVVACGRKVLKSFGSGELMTDGLYRIFRNPMYAAYLLFVIPGVSFLFNSWLALTTVMINYLLFHAFIKREHVYLKERFGSEYDHYLHKVLFKFL